MTDLKPGDKVIITNMKSARYGQTGILVSEGVNGGWYVKFDDGEMVYIPFGWQKVF